MSNFMKILSMGAEMFHGDGWTAVRTDRHTHTDRQTDRHDKANSHFSKFCKCTKETEHLTATVQSLFLATKTELFPLHFY
jgi:hypothetical protein